MKTNNLFNSTFEMELRILLVLSEYKKAISLDRIINIDFIVSYAADFQLPYPNLHGDNNYMYAEIVSRRAQMLEAIKSLVIHGLAAAEIDDGYVFKITGAGKNYIKELSSEYAEEYREICAEAIRKFKKYSTADLDKAIQDNAVKALGGS